jgi:hypothetical protein
MVILTGFTVWIIYLLQNSRFLPFTWQGGMTEAVFYTVSQTFFWILGTFIAMGLAGAELNVSPSGAIAISVLAVPALLLISSMDYPITQMLITIAVWYLALSFTLATRGKGHHRYGIILFHTMMPCLIATLLFFGIFSDQFQLFFRGLQNILEAIQLFFSRLMNMLYNGLPSYESNDKDLFESYNNTKIPGKKVFNLQDLNILLGIIIAFCCIVILWKFVKLLKTRLAPTKRSLPNEKISLFASLRDGLTAFVHFWLGFFRLFIKVFRLFWQGALWLKHIIMAFVNKLLPPKTPDQAIFRIYWQFLRWGSRKHVYRTNAETPLEYAARLENSFKKQSIPIHEIRQLTLYFLQTRYRNKAVDWKIAQECKCLFKMIKSTRVN